MPRPFFNVQSLAHWPACNFQLPSNPGRRGIASRATLLLLPLVVGLEGCTTGMGAALQSVQELVQRSPAADAVNLDPAFPFLRTTMAGRVGFAWLGNTERDAHGPLEVFYSGSGEMVRLQHGRIVSAIGFATEWRKAEWPQLPSWASVANASAPLSYVRVRDVMPGYRTGLRDELTLRVIEAPAKSALRGVDASSLVWFEERFRPTSIASDYRRLAAGTANDALPAAKYAVEIAGERETVVYSEQCLARDFCFTWQRWSAAMQEALHDSVAER